MENNGNGRLVLPPWWAVLSLVPFAALALHTDSRWFWSDNAAYLLLAKALATGRGYADIYWPGAPPHSHFPPGMALFLAPVVAVFGASALPAGILMVATGILTAMMSYSIAARRLSKKEALALFYIFGTSPFYWMNCGDVSSDVSFSLISMIAIYFTDKASRSGRVMSKDLIFAVFFLIAGYYFRTVGMALIAGGAAYLLATGPDPIRKRFYRALLAGSISTAAAIPWMVYTSKISHDTYFSLLRVSEKGATASYGEIAARSLPRFAFYCSAFLEWSVHGVSVLHHRFPAIFWPATTIVVLFTIIGLFKSLIQRRSAGEYYVIFYMLLILPWFWYFDRFLMPVMIFLLIDFEVSAKDLVHRRLGTRGKLIFSRAALVFVAALVAINAAGNVRYMKKRLAPDAPRDDFYASSNWVRDHTPADSIIFSRLSIPASLNGDRVADEDSLRNPPERAMELISPHHHAYLLTQGMDLDFEARRIQPLLIKYPNRFREIYRAQGGTSALYEVLPAP